MNNSDFNILPGDINASSTSSSTYLCAYLESARKSVKAYEQEIEAILNQEDNDFAAIVQDGDIVTGASLERLHFVNPNIAYVSWPLHGNYEVHEEPVSTVLDRIEALTNPDGVYKHFPSRALWLSDANQWIAGVSSLDGGNPLYFEAKEIDGIKATDTDVYRSLLRHCCLADGFGLHIDGEAINPDVLMEDLRYNYVSALVVSQLCEACLSNSKLTWPDISLKVQDSCGDDEMCRSVLSEWACQFSEDLISPDGKALLGKLSSAVAVSKFNAQVEMIDMSDMRRVELGKSALSWSMVSTAFGTVAEYALDILSVAGWAIHPIVGAIATIGCLAYKLGKAAYDLGEVTIDKMVQEPDQLDEPVSVFDADAFEFRYSTKTFVCQTRGAFANLGKAILTEGIVKIDLGFANLYAGLSSVNVSPTLDASGNVTGTARVRFTLHLKVPAYLPNVDASPILSVTGLEGYDSKYKYHLIDELGRDVTGPFDAMEKYLFRYNPNHVNSSGETVSSVNVPVFVGSMNSLTPVAYERDVSESARAILFAIYRLLYAYELSASSRNCVYGTFPYLVRNTNEYFLWSDVLGRSLLSFEKVSQTEFNWHVRDRALSRARTPGDSGSSPWSKEDDKQLSVALEQAVWYYGQLSPVKTSMKTVRRCLASPRVMFVADDYLQMCVDLIFDSLDTLLSSEHGLAGEIDGVPYAIIPRFPTSGIDIPSDEVYQLRTTLFVTGALLATAATAVAVTGKIVRKKVKANLRLHKANVDAAGRKYAAGDISAEAYKTELKTYDKHVKKARWFGVTLSGQDSPSSTNVQGLMAVLPTEEMITGTIDSVRENLTDNIQAIKDVITGGNNEDDEPLTPEQAINSVLEKVTKMEAAVQRLNDIVV